MVALQDDLGGHGQRNRQQHSHRAEYPAPEHQRHEDHQCGQAEPLAHESRFKQIAYAEIDDQVAGCGNDALGQSAVFGLNQGNNNRGDRGDKRTDAGYEVQQKRDQAEDVRVIDFENDQPDGDQYAG